MRFRPCALAVALLVPALGLAWAQEAADDIPVVGRPADLPFSEASGRFEVMARADPTAPAAGKPLTLTIAVRAAVPSRGAALRPPQRIDLRQIPTFAADFYIEDMPDVISATGPWDFAYRLTPRRAGVDEVPSFPFAFYNPEIRPPARAFQVIYTDPIPLHVVPPPPADVPIRAPEAAFVLATGPSVLVREGRGWPPGALALAVLLLAPPLAACACYLVRLRLRPDAARQARQRRSRAARVALQALRGPRLDADAARSAVADYLRWRFELAPVEPTPGEVAAHLSSRGCPADLVAQAERFFQACDAQRFGPAGSGTVAPLAETGVAFILAVEALPCAS